MPVIYNPKEATTKDLFKDKEGFIIPDYQRKYSWKQDNISQLFEDICSEATDYTDAFEQNSGNEQNAIRFLGTLIQIKQEGADFTQKYPQTTPEAVISIVDGQQRISTIILIFLALYGKLVELRESFGTGKDDITDKLIEIIDQKKVEILNIVSIELNGKPKRKPRIIRAESDSWTYEGNISRHYTSGIAQSVALLLKMLHEDKNTAKDLLSIKNDIDEDLVRKNLEYIEKLIDGVINSHLDDKGNPTIGDAEIPFPPASKIAGLGSKLNSVWYDPNHDLISIILNQSNHQHYKKIVVTLQSMYFCFFLMQRCYFVSIVAPDEDRAFDMFQSLNTSGTPLTAIETFRPMVARDFNATSRQSVEDHFTTVLKYIDALDNDNNSSDLKLKATNTLLLNFAYVNSGFSLTKTFSNQRRWLQKKFSEAENTDEKEMFIGRLAEVAQFLHTLHRVKKGDLSELEGLDNLSADERDLATFNTVFLDDAGNELAKTILARFYSRVVRDLPNSQKDFYEVTKMVVAFFVLWRAASTNARLDEAYRRTLIGEMDRMGTKKYKGICWEDTQDTVTIETLRTILVEGLGRKNLNDKSLWLNNARSRLNYDDAKTICKFVLLLVSYNRDVSKTEHGLWGDIVRATSEDRLSAYYYKAKKHHTIEHVAPDTQRGDWDQNIYGGASQLKHSIGNLTLLPMELNSEIGNSSWQRKWIYFWQVGTSSKGTSDDVKGKAQTLGISIDNKLIDKLAKDAEYIRVNAPIASMDPTKNIWNASFIEKRRDQILELTWGILSMWLGII